MYVIFEAWALKVKKKSHLHDWVDENLLINNGFGMVNSFLCSILTRFGGMDSFILINVKSFI